MRAGGAVARGVPGVPVEPVSCEVMAEVPPVWWPQAGGPSVHPRSGGRDREAECAGAPGRRGDRWGTIDLPTPLPAYRSTSESEGSSYTKPTGSPSTACRSRVSYNPTPTTPLGFTARVSPAWGGDAMNGAEALWGRESMGEWATSR